MPTVTFIEFDETEHKITMEPGGTLMQAALDNGIPGIDGDCGGACACGTCHVIVQGDWLAKMSPASDTEKDMLSLTPESTETSRLSCQVKVDDELDGLVVRLPEFQM